MMRGETVQFSSCQKRYTTKLNKQTEDLDNTDVNDFQIKIVNIDTDILYREVDGIIKVSEIWFDLRQHGWNMAKNHQSIFKFGI